MALPQRARIGMRAALFLLGLCIAAGHVSAPATADEAGVAADPLYAERIDESNAATRRLGGLHAIGGIDDWALGNGKICAVVSDPAHESVLTPRGGLLVDLGYCGRRDDQWNVLQPLYNLSRGSVPPVDSVRAERDEREARIVTSGQSQGVLFETRYAVDLQEPEALRIRTTLRRVGEGDRVFLVGDVALHGNASLAPFTLSRRHPERSVGLRHPWVDADDQLSMVRGLVAGDAHVLIGNDAGSPGIAYGLSLDSARLITTEGVAQELAPVALNGRHFTTLAFFSRPFWFGSEEPPSWLQLAQAFFMDLDEGESLIYERRIWLGDRADAASITDRLWPQATRIRASSDDPHSVVEVFREDDSPFTLVRSDEQGDFSFRVPPGRYRIEARAAGGRRFERSVPVGRPELDLGRLAFAEPARLELPRGRAMRLVFLGQGDTANPRFGDDLLGFHIGEKAMESGTLTNEVSLAGTPDDPRSLILAPGRYRVIAGRGLEHDLRETTVTLEAGTKQSLQIETPPRVLETPGWMAADLHLHSGRSDDSHLALRPRVASFVAQGLEVAVATDHDQVTDYGPLLEELGLADEIASVVGSELSSTARSDKVPHTAGHMNVMPLVEDARRYRGGAPAAEDRRLREILTSLRERAPRTLVQLNHPRGESGEEQTNELYFSHLAVAGEPFDPLSPLDAWPNRVLLEEHPESGLRDLDFDVMELMNGPHLGRYRTTRADWFGLLLQGEFRAATANSDSHRLGETVALPRTYVRMKRDDAKRFRERSFLRAVRRGRSYGTTGPLLDVKLGTASIGDRVKGEDATLSLQVDAAPWVPVSRARVYVNAELTHTFEIRSAERIEVPMHFDSDAFVTIEVEGEAGELYAAVSPGAKPFAFTNPIFVDADGDGEWQAPGWPSALPESISQPGTLQ